MNFISIIGTMAATLTTGCYVFQAAKSWHTKHTKDLSLGMFFTLTAGTILWLIYGLLLSQPPIYLANGITLVLSLMLLYLKLKYG